MKKSFQLIYYRLYLILFLGEAGESIEYFIDILDRQFRFCRRLHILWHLEKLCDRLGNVTILKIGQHLVLASAKDTTEDFDKLQKIKVFSN